MIRRRDTRSRTLITQKQVLWFCSEQRAVFGLIFEGEGARVKVPDCRNEASLTRAVSGGSEIQE